MSRPSTAPYYRFHDINSYSVQHWEFYEQVYVQSRVMPTEGGLGFLICNQCTTMLTAVPSEMVLVIADVLPTGDLSSISRGRVALAVELSYTTDRLFGRFVSGHFFPTACLSTVLYIHLPPRSQGHYVVYRIRKDTMPWRP